LKEPYLGSGQEQGNWKRATPTHTSSIYKPVTDATRTTCLWSCTTVARSALTRPRRIWYSPTTMIFLGSASVASTESIWIGWICWHWTSLTRSLRSQTIRSPGLFVWPWA